LLPGPRAGRRARDAPPGGPLPPRARHALPAHGRPGKGAGASDHRCHDVRRDGHDLLAGEGGGATGATPREFTVNRTGRFVRLAALAMLALALLAAPLAAEAQPARKVPRIGFLSTDAAADSSAALDAFRQGLRALGYVEGQNIAVEWRFAAGRLDRLTT